MAAIEELELTGHKSIKGSNVRVYGSSEPGGHVSAGAFNIRNAKYREMVYKTGPDDWTKAISLEGHSEDGEYITFTFYVPAEEPTKFKKGKDYTMKEKVIF